jgi:hypothetical protein
MALIVALNYFAFRTELCEEEYEQNHPEHSDTVSFTLFSVNWETFDKDNAPKAFTVNVDPQVEFLFAVTAPLQVSKLSFQPFQPVRDKSPPK